jgi:hypothetical protein
MMLRMVSRELPANVQPRHAAALAAKSPDRGGVLSWVPENKAERAILLLVYPIYLHRREPLGKPSFPVFPAVSMIPADAGR